MLADFENPNGQTGEAKYRPWRHSFHYLCGVDVPELHGPDGKDSLSVSTGYNFRLSVSDIVMFEERDHFPSSGGRG